MDQITEGSGGLQKLMAAVPPMHQAAVAEKWSQLAGVKNGVSRLRQLREWVIINGYGTRADVMSIDLEEDKELRTEVKS